MTALLKTASKQWDVLRHAWNDVLRDANEDSVHELRVASRRILSCLSLVDSILLANHRSKARRKIKRLMKKLGPLRDVQVQTSISRSWPRSKAPLGFQEYLKRRIVTKSKAVQSYLTDKRKRAIRDSLKDAELDARRSLQDLSPELVRSRLSSALESQRDEFHAAKAAAKSQDRKKVHRLRVAAKRLRYSLEALEPDLTENPDAEVRALRRYQKDLGRKRDLSILKDALHDWRSRQRRKSPANVSGRPPRRTASVSA